MVNDWYEKAKQLNGGLELPGKLYDTLRNIHSLCQQSGGCLRSRQVIAAVIVLTWEKRKDADCGHERLDEDGICRRCGADKRGI